jgi:septum site-determining protein MinC
VRRLADDERVPLAEIAQVLDSVRMRPVGVVANPQQGWAAESALPLLEARDRRGAGAKATAEEEAPGADSGVATGGTAKAQGELPMDVPAAAVEVVAGTAGGGGAAGVQPTAAGDAAKLVTSSQTTVVDKPLRSGQRIYAKGDLVVLGLVSYGAEVIAEGNIHIYAPLRGRALAGVQGNHDARIFCTCLEPELISIAGIYRTTENPLPADVLGKPVQIWLDEEKLMIEPLRLT